VAGTIVAFWVRWPSGMAEARKGSGPSGRLGVLIPPVKAFIGSDRKNAHMRIFSVSLDFCFFRGFGVIFDWAG
jgi:hypothetical protein